MFAKILIANRGEIACRIIRTARRLGIATVAVYSEADAGALHVRIADEARCIGPPPAAESYLSVEAILEAARKSGAEAVHPGYGFLSENAAFAERCREAGLVFVGPGAEAIRLMGSKSAAKEVMAKAGVPVVPGYHGEGQDDGLFAREAGKLGYPLLLKPSAGGGGKGMKVVRKAAEFAEALASARREARAAFGDQRMLLEKYLERPRHVEIQIFADGPGNTVHLFERDCSLQRRHQKILEESPAPGLSDELRSEMGRAAVAAARAIGYLGAGTVEFLLDKDGSFYFMEMNTRLQVEHPVTEMITGLDLVEWQLRVAAGEPLPCCQEELTFAGHAIEARIYAEDPERDFAPAAGTLTLLRHPEQDSHLRIDSGVEEGDAVPVHYDPLIAKMIVRGGDRNAALGRLQRALADWAVAGVATNLNLLAAVAQHSAYREGKIWTRFIEEHRQELLPSPASTPPDILALAGLFLVLRVDADRAAAAAVSSDPHAPWHKGGNWRLTGPEAYRFTVAGTEMVLKPEPGGYRLHLPGSEFPIRGHLAPEHRLEAEVDGRRFRATVLAEEQRLTLVVGGRHHRLDLEADAAEAGEHHQQSGMLEAEMPSRIVEVRTKEGDEVAEGQTLVVLEAMKMELTVAAPFKGKVKRVHYAPGETVQEGDLLVTLEPVED